MSYDDMVPAIRSALAVGTSKDEEILAALRRNAVFLLRNYNFPEALTFAESTALADGAQTSALPDGVGKIKAVRLALTGDDPALYKILHRREEHVLPAVEGPAYWHRIG